MTNDPSPLTRAAALAHVVDLIDSYDLRENCDPEKVLAAAFVCDSAGGYLQHGDLLRAIMQHTRPDSTPVECPSWCELAPGHGYSGWTHERLHDRDHGLSLARDVSRWYVGLAQNETALSEVGPIERTPPYVVLAGPDNDTGDLTSAAARELAEWLTRAADLLDTITQGEDDADDTDAPG